MPKVLKSFEFIHKGRSRVYDFTACQTSPVLFLRSKDYKCKDSSFISIAYGRAAAIKMRMRSQIVDNGVVIQFFPKEKP